MSTIVKRVRPAQVKTKPASVARQAIQWGVLTLLVLAAPFLLRTNNFYMHLADLALIYGIAVVGYNICFGDAGQISLGHAGFFAIGAYSTGLLTTDAHLPVWIGLLAGAVLPAVLAFIVGWPCLRLQGHYLALATVGVGEIVRIVIQNWDAVTHGTVGVRNIPKPSFGGLVLNSEFSFYFFALGVLALLALAAMRIGRSRFGIAFKAVRDDEIAARSAGLSATRLKVAAFTISAVYAGIAGAMYAQLTSYISPDYFNFDLSISLLIMLVVGGVGTIAGAILGAVLLTFLPELLRVAQEAYLLIYGVGVILLVIYMPGGIVGALRSFIAKRAGRGESDVPGQPGLLDASP